MATTALSKGYGKLGIALAIFVAWAVITMGAEQLQVGSTVSLDELVGQRVVIGLFLAPAFLIAAMIWLRWDGLGLSSPTPRRALLVLWLPLLYITLILAGTAAQGFPPPRTVGFVLVNTMLVGISEELMFRGILLRGALSRMTIWPAIWLSCILFGLVHTLNVVITGEALNAVLQAAAAFMSGVFYVAVRIRTRSLYPMIVVHTLWDFSLFLGVSAAVPAAETQELTTPAQLLAPLVLVAPLFLYGMFLLRHAKRDFGDMSDVAAGRVSLNEQQ